MIARPDWLRRKYLFSGAVIAAALTLLVAMERESARIAPVRVVPASGAVRHVVVNDPWRPMDAPMAVRAEGSAWSR